MRKIVVLLFITTLLWGCANNDKKSAETGNVTAKTDPTQHPDYAKGFELVANSDCFSCHKISEKFVGPAYSDVAAKYAGQPDVIDTLANRIINGSVGHWGQVPMLPHSTLSLEDARAMVKYVLTHK